MTENYSRDCSFRLNKDVKKLMQGECHIRITFTEVRCRCTVEVFFWWASLCPSHSVEDTHSLSVEETHTTFVSQWKMASLLKWNTWWYHSNILNSNMFALCLLSLLLLSLNYLIVVHSKCNKPMTEVYVQRQPKWGQVFMIWCNGMGKSSIKTILETVFSW